MTVSRKFHNDEFYHTYNRGVDKRKIFRDYSDERRFLKGCKQFRYESPTLLRSATEHDAPVESSEKVQLLVDLASFCLMGNHYHALCKQRMDGGISKFMSKLSSGYTKYFNKRWERSGYLFQSRFQDEHIDDDGYLLRVLCYIHANPLVYFQADWKKEGLRDINGALDFLSRYRHSSHRHYMALEDISWIRSKFIEDILPRGKEYQGFFTEYLQSVRPAGLDGG